MRVSVGTPRWFMAPEEGEGGSSAATATTEGEGSESNDGDGGSSAEPAKVLQTQADIDAFKAKATEAEKKRADRLQAELDKRLSDEEKAQREAEEAREREATEAKTNASKTGYLVGQLESKYGLDTAQAERLAGIVGTDYESVSAAVETLKSDYGMTLEEKKGGGDFGPGQGGNAPSGFEDTFTQEAVQKNRENMSHPDFRRWYRENQTKIEAQRKAAARGK